MNGETVLSAGVLATLVMEAIKQIFRKANNDPAFELPAWAYAVGLPVLAFLAEPFLAWLGLVEYSMPTNIEAWAKQLVIVALSSAVALVTYGMGVKGLSNYARDRALAKREE